MSAHAQVSSEEEVSETLLMKACFKAKAVAGWKWVSFQCWVWGYGCAVHMVALHTIVITVLFFCP